MIQLWVAEYSAVQDAFNVDTLGRVLDTNRALVEKKEKIDYLMFGIFRTQEEADTACEDMRSKSDEYSKEKVLCQSRKN